MTPRILTGMPVAEAIASMLESRVTRLIKVGTRPGLAVITNGPSSSLARYRDLLAERLGIMVRTVALPEQLSRADLTAAVRDLSAAPDIHGVLLPRTRLSPEVFLAGMLALDPAKDVEGLHPENIGRLAFGLGGQVPCLAAAVEAVLTYHDIGVADRNVAILGRSLELARPLSLLLSQKRPTANAAVTILHTGLPDWAEYTRRADVIISTVRMPGLVQPEHIRPGVSLVAVSESEDGSSSSDFDDRCTVIAGAITPASGGVEPVAVAMLMKNIADAAAR